MMCSLMFRLCILTLANEKYSNVFFAILKRAMVQGQRSALIQSAAEGLPSVGSSNGWEEKPANVRKIV